MAISGKYGKINIPKIGEDEPVFILRAQDKLALWLVEIYKVLAESHGCRFEEPLDKEIKRLRDWKGPKKMPD
jgi:hypothetical protein